MEGRIDDVQAQIDEVAKSVKAVQSQVVNVGVLIGATETALEAADLSSENGWRGWAHVRGKQLAKGDGGTGSDDFVCAHTQKIN